MQKIERIIVATSLNEASDQVVAAADAVAQHTGAELHVFHSIMPPMGYYSSAMGMSVAYPETVEAQEKWGQMQVKEQLLRLGIAEGKYPIHIEVGSPHRTLLEAAETLKAGLLVVGATEVVKPLVPILGSTADRVLRKATCPVLVIKGDFNLSPSRVLAPVDLSDLCEDSLRRGLQVLQQIRDGAPPEVEPFFVLSQVDREHSVQFTAEQIDRFASEELDRFLERLGDPYGAKIVPHLCSGHPKDEILERLEKAPAELVIMGTHGRSGFERLLLGSVTSEVVRSTPTNILVVPPGAAAEGG